MFIVFLLLFCPGVVYSQVVLSGAVLDSTTHKPVAGVNVILQNKDGSGILKFAITKEDGKYEFQYAANVDSLRVAVTGFSIQQQSKPVPYRTQTVDFYVSESVFEIREVLVKAPEIVRRSDTLTYNVGSFADEADRSIGDVIRKMPGIQVAESGAITYQGRAINKFYIEDMDMLQGRYGIATNNIQAKDVASVQVYENHQPVRALKEVESSESAAINLRLKESAKGTFNAVLQAGTGYEPGMWNGEFVPMYFSGNFQTLGFYKTNNAGEDVSRELTVHSGAADRVRAPISVTAPSPPPLNQQRHLNNNIHAVSANTITKLDNETTLTVNASYVHDEQTAAGYSQTNYLFPDQPALLITETMEYSGIRDNVEGSVRYEANKEAFFLSENLSFSSRTNRARNRVLNRDEDIRERQRTPDVWIDNDFRLTKVKNGNRVSFTSKSHFQQQSPTLTVTPLLYEGILGEEGHSGISQHLRMQRFASNNSVFLGRYFGRFYVSLNSSVNANLNKTHSSLGPEAVSGLSHDVPDSMKNDLDYHRFDLRIGPYATYKTGRFELSLSSPVNYMALQFKDRIEEGNDKQKNTLYWMPSGSFNWSLSYNLKLNGNASYSINSGSEMSLYSGYIMSTYRTIGNRRGVLPESRSQNYGLSLAYGDALKSLFASLEARHWRSRANTMYGTVFSGALSWSESYHMPNVSEGYVLGGKISKRIQPMATTLGFSSQYIRSSADVLRQGALMHTRSDTYNAGFNAVTRFKNAARFDYDVSWMRNKTSAKNAEAAFKPIDVLRQEAALVFFLTRTIHLRLAGEHYYNTAVSGGGKSMWFGDAVLSWKARRVEYVLEGRNLLNTTTYESASYGSMVDYVYRYRLRQPSVMFKMKFSLK